MAIKQLTPTLSVTAQLTPADIAQAAAMGFRAILCNRPDGEGADQPTAEEMGAAARAAGLDFAYVPAVAGALTDADAIAMRAALDKHLSPPVPRLLHVAAEAALRERLPILPKHRPVEPGRAVVAHLPVQREVGHFIDARAGSV